MAKIAYQKLTDHSSFFWGLLGFHVLVIAAGLGAALYMEHHGHVVTGMSNQIVWGAPHVFAVFLIVAASGALNVASFSSVFNKLAYKPYARLSGVLAIALLMGGLAILVLDLGRPDRLIVAMTTYNFRSIFAWNIYLYVGFIAVVGLYLYVMMDRRVSRSETPTRIVGGFAFFWRFALTTGTGSIFGFLIARDAYSSAIMAVLFIAASFLYGLAFTVLVLLTMSRETRHELISEDMLGKFRGLFILFALAVLYITTVFHLTKLYAPDYREVETFLLRDGGIYTLAFWVGQIGIGLLLPLAILVLRGSGRHAWHAVAIAAPLFLIGGVAQMYFTIIGGQAYPLRLFPGMQVLSSFHDGAIAQYWPSLPEVLLGVSGVSLAMLLTGVALKLLPFLPRPASV
ncbi:polysulfide reductase NrfD [Rhodomicrobium vannielii ATCC 17100]|uniref:NrfD/PsrC family molybdoenzyme membrane anchor subunit n=1 Tax=Rhodomicrobium vannielii TaxID=1069 RepID=UPI00191A8B27|nr:NrfD/PsrC family molybdoenzyme membrane anchor subunit [Rhodomicrobium vannielii]MBJ7534246.1 polysulfide reductase NrfD [Rhodomicrobium vannielii ATCC 17100]